MDAYDPSMSDELTKLKMENHTLKLRLKVHEVLCMDKGAKALSDDIERFRLEAWQAMRQRDAQARHNTKLRKQLLEALS